MTLEQKLIDALDASVYICHATSEQILLPLGTRMVTKV
mgnify:FL=1